MTVVEDALQAETFFGRAMYRAVRTFAEVSAGLNMLHFQNVVVYDVVAIAGSIRAGFVGMKKREQHPAGFDGRPEACHHRLNQAFMHVIGQIPA